jgi:hypothetical protein
MSRAWLIAAGVVAVAATVGVVAWLVVFRDTATPVDVGEAVTSFRGETQPVSEPSPVPVGVYVYATEGYEKTDALTGVTHHYPLRSTITVTRDPCGVRMRWDVLEGRSTTWTFCIASGNWVMTTQDERHTFFGVTRSTTYACSNVPFRTPDDTPGPRYSATCATPSAREYEKQWVVGRERLLVGGKRVSAVHVRQTTGFGGGTGGASVYDIWLDRESGVPVRISMTSQTTNTSPIGKVHYDEKVVLRLTSLQPRR